MLSVASVTNRTIDALKLGGAAALFLHEARAAETAAPPEPELIEITTHGSPETLGLLGNISDRLHIWAGNKPVLVLSAKDFEGMEITSETLLAHLQKITGLPPEKLPSGGYLSNMAKKIKEEADAAHLSEKSGSELCFIVVDTHETMDEILTGFSGIPAKDFEFVPGTLPEWRAFVLRHEAGHCARPSPSTGGLDWKGTLQGEIFADQHAVHLEELEARDPVVPSTTFIARDAVLLRMLGTVHGQSHVTHFTSPSVVLPGETAVAAYQNAATMWDSNYNISRALSIKVSHYVTDKSVWEKGLNFALQFAEIEERSATDIITPATATFLRDNEARIRSDLRALPLTAFLEKYKSHPEFVDFLKQSTGILFIEENKNKFGVSIVARAARDRLTELTGESFEKRYLSRYVEAVQRFFPQTYATTLQARSDRTGPALAPR